MFSSQGFPVISDRKAPDAELGRILNFRRRGVPPPGRWRWPELEPEQAIAIDGFDKYERGDVGVADDDFHQRMKMNSLALVATLVLVVLGIWLTRQLGDMHNEQNCSRSGRSYCWPIQLPVSKDDLDLMRGFAGAGSA